jgi:hypothetical protein
MMASCSFSFALPIKKKKKQALMEGLEENEASQEADYINKFFF